ncbi:hypothetical protein B0H13DRAFT_2328020 [Mycena leptocephala]|nr:hypothetical protein B0H13DRAFT_2328020 [Mycena leptocephala]
MDSESQSAEQKDPAAPVTQLATPNFPATSTSLPSPPVPHYSATDNSASILDALVGVPTSDAPSTLRLARPPHAYVLFRSFFIRDMPGASPELAWQAFPKEQKGVWYAKAREARAEHASKFPPYARRQPKHSRGNGKSTRL